MNKTLVLIAAAAALLQGYAADDSEGGFLEIWPENHGTFLFVNAQQAVPQEVLEKPITHLTQDMSYDIRIKRGNPVDIRVVPAELNALKAKGAIWIVDDPTLPLVLAACESGWGVLNVSPILADKPNAAKVSARLVRVINRLFAYIHGACEPVMVPQCVLKQAVGVAGIDQLPCSGYSPETFAKVTKFMTACGYGSCKRGSYYDACEQGWAPAPTNDVQKAIWKKVHTPPSEPIKIKYEKPAKK